MKNENKTTSVLILIFPGKNALWNHRKSLKNGSAKLFVSLRKFNHICRPSFYTENGYKKEICKFLGYEWIRIRNITHKNLFFFGYYIHPHQKLLTKKKRVLFVDESFVIFTCSKVKKKYANPVPSKFLASYVEVYDKTRMSSYKKMKNIWKRDYTAFVH